MAGEDGRVDMAVVSKRLERCQQLEAIDLSAYLEAYRDLYRFFRRMGRLFEFVASDVISKIEILEKYVESENGAHYETVEGMLRYEKEIGSAGGGKKAPSGSRTLLRLHRALEFIVILLDKFAALGDDEATGPSAEAAYLATIAPFHIWLVRKGALFAVRRLPTLRQLVEKTTVHSVQQFKTLIPDTVRLGRRVYDLTQDTYGRYDCLDLP